MIYTIAVFRIPSGKDYIRFDSMLSAVKHIKKDVDKLICLLPSVDLAGISTADEFVTLIEEHITSRKCITKEKLTAIVGGNNVSH